MRPIDADELEELFREVIGGIARQKDMNGAQEHMVRASAMVVEMINDAPTLDVIPVEWITNLLDDMRKTAENDKYKAEIRQTVAEAVDVIVALLFTWMEKGNG